MSRPLNKKYFGNRNVGSASTSADDGIGGEGVASVTIGGSWAGFTALTTTVTFTAPQLPGGVTATGTAVINGGGAVTGVTITEPGSGYTSAPTVTIVDSDGGAETTGTATAVLTTTGQANAAQNTTGTNENAIIGYAWVDGGRELVDIVAQKGSKRYIVKGASGTVNTAMLIAETANADGEMEIRATDSDGGTYWITKLTSRLAVVEPDSGTQFASGQRVKWNLVSASEDVSVKVENA